MSALTVLSCGPGLSIQDAGRFGWQRFGMGPSGAMDVIGLSAANLLVGNAALTGALELPLAGAKFRVDQGDVTFAVAGAATRVAVDGRTIPMLTTARAREGETIEIATAQTGVFIYLAVAGGFAIAPMLGSQALHARNAIGALDGSTLKPGDTLPIATQVSPLADGLTSTTPLPYGNGPIRVLLGPQADHFTERGIATFLNAPYTITPQADRMGFRLAGEKIEHSAKGYNIVSDGIATGTVQVPGGGEPIILLADRQTTGGYPKIATVISADLPRLAQTRPGGTLRFASITRNEAITARRLMQTSLTAFANAKRPAASELDAGLLLAENLISGVVAGE